MGKAGYRHAQASRSCRSGVRGSCGTRPLRDPLRGPSGLHRVLFCKVAASRCAKAPLGVIHRFAPWRVYKTHPMQSTSAGYGRTAVGAPPVAFAPYAPPSGSLVAVVAPGHWSGASRRVLVSGLRPVILCVPRPPLGLAASRHWPCAGLPVRPQGAPSAQRFHIQSHAAPAGPQKQKPGTSPGFCLNYRSIHTSFLPWVETWVGSGKPLVTRMNTHLLAEQAGFEPAEGFTPRTLSRRVT